MSARNYFAIREDAVLIDAVEPDESLRAGAKPALFGLSLKLSITGLEGYFCAGWRPDLVDLLIIAAAVEFCDLSVRRPSWGWARAFDLRVAVHEVDQWKAEPVHTALQEALTFLTGDRWDLSFCKRARSVKQVDQIKLALAMPDRIIMPYSDGLDSRAVAALVEAEEGGGLVRVRLGSRGADSKPKDRKRRRFTTVPYDVRLARHERIESSARSRGFKFAVITAIAAKLANVDRIVVTESGQGVIGPIIASTGQGYPDYRVHPAFTRRIERLFEALTGRAPRYEYPRIWHTKGETMAAANALANPPTWDDTRSCWQNSRQVSFEKRRRQCGICAACMLRRLSMHSAGISESAAEYIWENLSAPDICSGTVEGFTLMTKALQEHAIAGILHLDHLAALSESELHRRAVRRVAYETADALDLDPGDAEHKLIDLLVRHRAEWLAFLASLGPESFVAKLALVSPWH